ncbi:MAG: helix-turn-helix domain-containing protein [Clostridia bacterium]|nr:helix-turn-helix domain-containing protein [Clostridia bacterium]
MDRFLTQPNASLTTMGRGKRGYEAFHSRNDRNALSEYHCHDFYEFYLHIHGGQYFGLDNSLYQLEPYQFFIIPPFFMHGLICSNDMKGYERAYLNVSPEVLKTLGCGQIDLDQFFRSRTARGQNIFRMSEEDVKKLLPWMDQLQADGDSLSALDCFQNYATLINLLSLVCRAIPQSPALATSVISNSVIQEVLTYINSNYTQPLKMDQLAKQFGISVSYLSHEFVRFTNRSVYDYVLYRRVMLARQMMQDDLSLNTIAYQCGFNDYSNFLRMFNKLVGMSPSAYRKHLYSLRAKKE